jgi:glycerate 2-kinase
MLRSADQLRADALAIWQAGLAGVQADRLVREHVQVLDSQLLIAEHEFALNSFDRIIVVGAGKAGAGMVAGFEQALGPTLLAKKQVTGWVNVPADCVRPSSRIVLHPARPAGVNEPTAEGVQGTERILDIVRQTGPRDLCVVLLSGGGSALTPAPVAEISLADKLAVTRALSANGANIAELNLVRKKLSRFKGGGLARACRAGQMICLVLSDVLGDPLDLIASGPTVDDPLTPAQALEILQRYRVTESGVEPHVLEYLRKQSTTFQSQQPTNCPTIVLGNNATAVDCAGIKAEQLGYSHAMLSANQPEGSVEEIGRHLARLAIQMRDKGGPDCLIMGGEGTVQLAPAAIRGRGGRNQHTVLAVLQELRATEMTGITILSAGTDGEDGPTNAAGAWCDAEIQQSAMTLGLDPADYLQRSDAYHFFEQTQSLLITGPTHTNVCDLRVVVVSRSV